MQSILDAAIARFVDSHPRSQELHASALLSLPGGNTRTALFTAPFPIFVARGDGYKIWDEDGNQYVPTRPMNEQHVTKVIIGITTLFPI